MNFVACRLIMKRKKHKVHTDYYQQRVRHFRQLFLATGHMHVCMHASITNLYIYIIHMCVRERERGKKQGKRFELTYSCFSDQFQRKHAKAKPQIRMVQHLEDSDFSFALLLQSIIQVMSDLVVAHKNSHWP